MFLILVSFALSFVIIWFGFTQGRVLFGAYEQTTDQIRKLTEKLESCSEGISFKEVLQGWTTTSDPITRSLARNLSRLFEKEPVRLHGRLGWVFDLEYLCDFKRYYKIHPSNERAGAMPGMLTGAGILFTFLGLTVGVFGLDPTDAEQMTQGVKKLLGGMSMAFLTSIAGIGTSLWWTWRGKDVVQHFESAFADLSEMLQDKSFPAHS